MNAIHINWSKPFLSRNNGEYKIEDFELFTTVLSALKWKEKNGKIKLCADETAMQYYKKTGIADIYDELEILTVDENINPQMFWAAGKLYALKNQTAPVAVIDTDFIVWDEIIFDALDDCTVIHFEELYPDIYPPYSFFDMKKSYKKQKLNENLPACNTAFYVIKSQKLIDEYTSCAIDFMNHARACDDSLRYMVFAEQRLLNMCADRLGIEVRAFSTQERLFCMEGDGFFTHIWGMKQQMRDNDELRRSFCRRCADRVKADFPEYSELADKILSGDI